MIKLKKACNGHALISFLMLLALLTLPSMALSEEDDTLFKIPIPDDFAPALQADGSPQYITAEEIENIIRQQSPEFTKLFRNKEIKRFIIPRHDWLENLLAAYDTLLVERGVRGKAETWDCENYSEFLNALTTIQIWKAGYYDTRGAIGWMMVDAKKEWAGLPGVLHALMFAVTENGFYIIEPQNGQTVHLDKYPNKHYIQEVYLF
jgi:hypothetical protein